MLSGEKRTSTTIQPCSLHPPHPPPPHRHAPGLKMTSRFTPSIRLMLQQCRGGSSVKTHTKKEEVATVENDETRPKRADNRSGVPPRREDETLTFRRSANQTGLHHKEPPPPNPNVKEMLKRGGLISSAWFQTSADLHRRLQVLDRCPKCRFIT